MSIEKFTYKQLVNPSVTSFAHFAFRLIPLELRTPSYDLRLLNGGANQDRPYSVADHLETERWNSGQAVQQRVLARETTARIAISEAALQNFGGGGKEEDDRRIQQEAISYIAFCALEGVDVRVVPLSADTRGAGTDDFMVADFEHEGSKVVTYNLSGGTIHDDPKLVAQTIANFEEIWQNSLSKEASIAHLQGVAADLVTPR